MINKAARCGAPLLLCLCAQAMGQGPLRIRFETISVQAGGMARVGFEGSPAGFLGQARLDASKRDPSKAQISGDGVWTIRIGDAREVPVELHDRDRDFEFHVPLELGDNNKATDYKVVLREDTTNTQVSGYATLVVYPAAIPNVTQLSGNSNLYVRREEVFTVEGSGLFAPAGSVRFEAHRESPSAGGPVEYKADVLSVASDGSSFTAVFRGAPPEVGRYDIRIRVWDVPVNTADCCITAVDANKRKGLLSGGLALLPLVPLAFLGSKLSRRIAGTNQQPRVRQAGRRDEQDPLDGGSPNESPVDGGQISSNPIRRVAETLLIDPESNTYSLSRLQFVVWITCIVWAYGFLFVTRGCATGYWGFPEFNGTEKVIMVSLGTLIASVGTAAIKGPKGSVGAEPTWRDIFGHGGVLALDRVQQLFWTIVASAMFLFLAIKQDPTASSVPPIPDDLINLMGISSVGYMAGKWLRKPGPAVRDVRLNESDNTKLEITGVNLSVNARVYLGDTEVGTDGIKADKDQMDSVAGTTKKLVVTVPKELKGFDLAKVEVKVVNMDQQSAAWKRRVGE